MLEAARSAGIDIPSLCDNDYLEPYGACRLCVVEVREKGRKGWRVVASCLYPLKEGLEIRTDSKLILQHRKLLVELMLARCSGNRYVRRLAKRFGVKRPRFGGGDEDCIMCGLCVRVCSEIVGAAAIGFSSRGISRKVETPFGIDSSKCIACGACTYVCPTGAINMEYERVIELRKNEKEHMCRYTLMGFLDEAVCMLNYECARCEVDQRMRDRFDTHPAFAMHGRLRGAAAAGRVKRTGKKGVK